ncbi:hypothetical protein C8R48DRAFT_764503 [Suillus tomentosus]|nr:hypothetical protein C8R48DRAFT_764503 [Suillus tomentosus]
MGLQLLGHLGYHLLIVQAVGAASAANTKTSASTSANIMLGGIAAQLYGLAYRRKPEANVLRYRVLKSVLISGYRTVELANGWAGPPITIEGYFSSLSLRRDDGPSHSSLLIEQLVCDCRTALAHLSML